MIKLQTKTYNRNYTNKATILYKAIVRPHLEYAATIWNPHKKGYIDDLEKVQRRATKLLQNISHLSYPERLAALNLPTLVYRRIRGDMIETFKILNNIYDSRVTNFLSKSNFSTTRGHNFNCLYNMQTLTSENGSSQFVLSTSGIVFLQTL